MAAVPSARPVAVAGRCRESAGSKAFRIGDDSSASSPVALDDEADRDDAGVLEEDEVPAPFSVEIGPARSSERGFVLSALRSLKGESRAFVAVLSPDLVTTKLVDLGRVHGDPEPPLVVERGADLLLAVPDGDAGGSMLRLGRLRDVRGAASLHWGPEITGVRADSSFAFEASADRALLVYVAETAGKARVFGLLLDPQNLDQKLAPQALGSETAEVDSPRLAARPGGYWLAVTRNSPPLKKKPNPGKNSASVEGEEPLLDRTTERVELTKLDARGKVASSTLVVTRESARGLSFELASSADGGAYVAFREEDDTPGAEGGALELVHVRADGGFEKVELSGETSGTGTPSLLTDAVDPTKTWLSGAGANGATWFGPIAETTALATDSVLRGADVLAARAGKLLVSHSKGTAAELFTLECRE